MSMTILSTKLCIPPQRPDLVPRPRLNQRLDEALRAERGLALVSAPAGFGKTTLIVAWLRHLQELGDSCPQVAWLGLDEADGDPARFLAYLLAALRSVDPSLGRFTAETSTSPQLLAPEPILSALINDIAALPRPLVLVLDDYHLVTTVSVHQQLAFLLDRRPSQLHLVIASREDPPLPLARLRARGQLVELRQADLAFTPAEAGEFLRCAAQRALSAADVAALQQTTEGWIAGLQLAALSLPGPAGMPRWLRELTGSQHHILDYLIQEVLARQLPATRDFLLRTSILDRLTASLCNVVAERQDSHEVLSALERANLFILPLDDSRAWYRYHHLFAGVLRHRLQAEKPADIPALHRRASAWYAGQGFVPDAIRHALAASDWDGAAELILGGTSSELLQRGELMTLLGWFRAFPDPIVRSSPRLCCEYAWPLMLTGQTEAAESYLDLAQQADRALVEGTRAARGFPTRLDAAAGSPAPPSAAPLGSVAPERLPERALVMLNLGMARWYRGHLSQAQEMLSGAQRAALASGDAYAWLTSSIYLNAGQMAAGKLHQAARTYAELIPQGEPLAMVSLACYDLGRLHYEWDELETAANWTTDGIRRAAQADGCEELQAVGFADLALIRQAQGRTAAAREGLELAAQKQAGSSCSPAGTLHCLAVRILVLAAQGDLPAARLAAADIPSAERAQSVPDYLLWRQAQVRLLLAEGQRAAAAELLGSLCEQALSLGWLARLIQLRALQALAAAAPDQAIPLLAEALAMAEPEGWVRTFLDLGEPMAALLEQALGRGIAPAYVRRLLRAFQAGAAMSQAHAPTPLPGLAEVLSLREIEVLRLLAGGLSNQELALRLCVSENTVKTHLANIYGKLGANGRRAAVAKARSLGLLA
jgi:LuxR family transcriptional regulator, maltose regulon positive regulatory protein